MATFLLSFALIAASIIGLAIGVIFRRPPLVAACGGAQCGPGSPCVCQGPQEGEPAK